ncbi:HRDC domain-containing protein [Ignatzschineria larvae DSM 13226]|uniref:HRDC domain-containing protein n=1 Tax=Ignatzschineria larvae DSM 13226 TaxID=1111732 RepID=A0ABZ3C4Y1_9GAMM|nr:HRDC domain-containing protein [Ignatzschineria larvae]
MKDHYIDTQEVLDQWCNTQLEEITLLALDTEFLRVKTYFPKLCLIQLATDQEAVCIDPLAIKDFTALNALLTAPHITKIIHSASQDLEAIIHALGILVTPVFDTQTAAQITFNKKVGISYHDLVLHYCDVDLTRDQTRTQWDLRPLSSEQLKYAYDDVHYLIPAYHKLVAEIEATGQQETLKNHLLPLTDQARYEPNPEMAWKKVKGSQRLRGSKKQLLKSLAKMRELVAIQQDIPKRWVIKDEILIHLAESYSQKNYKLYDDYAVTSYSEVIQNQIIRTIENFWKQQPSLLDDEESEDEE